MEIRFRNPYRHWFIGLFAELAAFAGLLLGVVALALLASLLA